MISTSSSATFTSPVPLVRPKSKANSRQSPSLSSVKFRPLRISAAACTTTAERASPHTQSTASTSTPNSLYDFLGIPMGATCKDIKAAYRRLARVLHPDVAATNSQNGSGGDFIKLHEAYTTLSDPVKRAQYDRLMYGRRCGCTATTFVRPQSRYTTTPRTWETDQCW